MFDALLPQYTYRRLGVRLAANWLKGNNSLRNRLNLKNWSYFRRYSGTRIACNVCGETSKAFFDFPDLELRRDHRIGELRETLQCNRCGATMRHRTLASAMLRIVSAVHGQPLSSLREAAALGFGNLRVLDTDSFSPISTLLRQLPSYIVSSFVPAQPFDIELEPNRYNVNLERMGFADSSFDMVISSDVAEHVRGIDAAHREISRVLRPGGHYVFTAPFDPKCLTHHVLVDTSGPQDVYLVPKQFHGDPLTGGILAYRVFGRAIHSDLAAVGLRTEFLCLNNDQALIVDGDVFIAEKLTLRP